MVDVAEVAVTALPTGSFLLDVREDDEWAAGHAPHAVHIPLAQVPARVDEVPLGQPIAVICRAGGRSARAAAFLASQGRDCVNVTGGMQAWAAAGLDMTTESNQSPQVI